MRNFNFLFKQLKKKGNDWSDMNMSKNISQKLQIIQIQDLNIY